MTFTIIVAGAAVVSGLLTAWSLVRMIKHRMREYTAGEAVHMRLRPTPTSNGLFSSHVKEPLLPLSAEAAHLPEAGEMMSSYWKSGLYGLLFLGSAGVFAVTVLMIWAVVVG